MANASAFSILKPEGRKLLGTRRGDWGIIIKWILWKEVVSWRNIVGSRVNNFPVRYVERFLYIIFSQFRLN